MYGYTAPQRNSLYSQPNKRSATMIRKDSMTPIVVIRESGLTIIELELELELDSNTITHPRCYIHQVNTHTRTHSSYNVQITQNHHLPVVCRLQTAAFTANKPSISSFQPLLASVTDRLLATITIFTSSRNKISNTHLILNINTGGGRGR